MAVVEIKGIVKKVHASSFTVAEKVQLPGYDFEKIYTIWSKEKYNVGDEVFVRGKLSMKSKTYGDEGKSYIDVSINDPIIHPLKIKAETIELGQTQTQTQIQTEINSETIEMQTETID